MSWTHSITTSNDWAHTLTTSNDWYFTISEGALEPGQSYIITKGDRSFITTKDGKKLITK